jgi:hypothetical protein
VKLPNGFLIFDSGGFVCINPEMFPKSFAQDVDAAQTKIMASTQKPASQSAFAKKSGPPAWSS